MEMVSRVHQRRYVFFFLVFFYEETTYNHQNHLPCPFPFPATFLASRPQFDPEDDSESRSARNQL